MIYDYFCDIFRKDVYNEFVHSQWLNSDYAISKCKNEDEEKIIKSIALIQIINRTDDISPDKKTVSLAAEYEDAEKAISDLIARDVLYERGSDGALVFKTKAGIELKKEIKRRRALIGSNVNYGEILESISGNHYVIPRRYNSMNKMTRFFRYEYMSVDAFLGIDKQETIAETDSFADGKVIILYSFDSIKKGKVEAHIKDFNSNKLVFVCPRRAIDIEKKLVSYEIVQSIKNDKGFNDENEILLRELPLYEEDIGTQVNYELDFVYDEKAVSVYFAHKGKMIKSNLSIEDAVNECCQSAYSKTPLINNEMVNRRSITTSQTRKTRSILISRVLRREDVSEYENGSSQEATIYRAIYANTNIGWQNNQPVNHVSECISRIESFIEESVGRRNALCNLIGVLEGSPYGMRRGVIPFYLAYVLTERNEDIVVYQRDVEVTLTADVLINMCEAPDDYDIFISVEDNEKEKYLTQIKNAFPFDSRRQSSDNRIKDIVSSMQRWYRSLPQVTKNLTLMEECVGEKHTTYLEGLKRELQPIEVNPYELLFVVLPSVYGEESLQKTGSKLLKSKREMDSHLRWLAEKAAQNTREVFSSKKGLLFSDIKGWYEKQSESVKLSLGNRKSVSLGACIEDLKEYDDETITEKIIHAVSDTYIENWKEGSLEEYLDDLRDAKEFVEKTASNDSDDTRKLVFENKYGKLVEKHYKFAEDGPGELLKDVLTDAMEDFDDMSVNDRVCVLLDIIDDLIN